MARTNNANQVKTPNKAKKLRARQTATLTPTKANKLRTKPTATLTPTKVTKVAALKDKWKFPNMTVKYVKPVVPHFGDDGELGKAAAKYARLHLLMFHLKATWITIDYFKQGIIACGFSPTEHKKKVASLMTAAAKHWNTLDLLNPSGYYKCEIYNYNVLADNRSKYPKLMKVLKAELRIENNEEEGADAEDAV